MSQSQPISPALAICGRNIRNRRELRKFSQQKLAKLTGVGRGTIELIEDGQLDPSVETCVLFAQALGTSAATLLNGVADLSNTKSVHIDADTIEGIENGEADTSVLTLIALARAIGVTPAALLDGVE